MTCRLVATGVAMVAGKLVFHAPPLRGVIGEEIDHGGMDLFRRFRKGPRSEMLQQAEISLLLPRHQMMDQHGALGGNRLMDRGTTGFSHNQMVAMEQLRHAPGPAEQTNAPRELGLQFLGPFVEKTDIAPEHNRQLDIR